MSKRIKIVKGETLKPKKPKKPTAGPSFSEMFATVFKDWFAGGTWDFWRIVAKAIFAEPLTADEMAVFTKHTGRTIEQTTPAREVWLAVGRRGGKDWFTAALLVYLACFREYRFKVGELGRVMLLAVDADQADVLFEYVSSLIDSIPECAGMVAKRSVKYGMRRLTLNNRIEILIKPADRRRVRGRTILAAVCDEIAHWWSDERHANPDTEVLKALRPSMLGVPGAILVCISSPYRRQGTMFEADKKYWGKNGDRILFIRAATWEARPVESEEHRILFPTFEAGLAEEKANDPSAFASEYGAEYRTELEDYLSLEAVEACVVQGRDVLPYDGRTHRMFVDLAGGGGGQDSAAACITKTLPDNKGAAVAWLFEKKPPYDSEALVDFLVEEAREFGIGLITGDNFSGGVYASMFQKRGISYVVEKRTATVLYRQFAPVVTGKKVELPDPRKSLTVERGLNQLVSLTKREGGEKITHASGEHDDVANVLAGGVLLSIKPPGGASVTAVTRVFGKAVEKPSEFRPLRRGEGFDPRGDDVEARDANVLRHCQHCMIPMNADYQRCFYYRDNHHRTCTRQGCTECALYCPYLNHKTAVVCTLPHM